MQSRAINSRVVEAAVTGDDFISMFISCSRSSAPWAAVYKQLHHTGNDVFFDHTGIPSGDFGFGSLKQGALSRGSADAT
jgi:hypothetical protein